MTDRPTPDTQIVLSEVREACVRGRGNPEKWSDPGRQSRFLDALRRGFSIGRACVQAGWAYNSWREWANAAERAEREGERCRYSDLFDAYREALRDGDERLYATVETAAESGDWRAATWILERRDSRSWAKAQEVEVSGPNGGSIAVDVRTALLDAARELSSADLGADDDPPAVAEVVAGGSRVD